jgi:hypothetical protein
MQKEDIPYIKELLYYKLRKDDIFLKIDDSIIAQYDATCIKI